MDTRLRRSFQRYCEARRQLIQLLLSLRQLRVRRYRDKSGRKMMTDTHAGSRFYVKMLVLSVALLPEISALTFILTCNVFQLHRDAELDWSLKEGRLFVKYSE